MSIRMENLPIHVIRRKEDLQEFIKHGVADLAAINNIEASPMCCLMEQKYINFVDKLEIMKVMLRQIPVLAYNVDKLGNALLHNYTANIECIPLNALRSFASVFLFLFVFCQS